MTHIRSRLARLALSGALAMSLAGSAGVAFTIGAVSPVLAASSSAATVTHYTASYFCGCFGLFTIEGVHLTNQEFPGTDDGAGSATGGRDNFAGTVSKPPAVETVLNDQNAGEWCSDYDGQCTTDWSLTIEPDGSLFGWAIYPNP